MDKIFTPSEQQAAFFDEVQNGSGNVVLEAVAGAGKTTTLVQALPYMRGHVAVVMFNKDAASDFRAKAAKAGVDRQGIKISTCHGAGVSAWMRFDKASADNLQERKTALIVEAWIEAGSELSRDDIMLLDNNVKYITKLVDLGKQYLFGISVRTTANGFSQLSDRFGLESELTEDTDIGRLHELCVEVFNRCAVACRSTAAKPGMIDYSDMIWAPLAYKCHFYTNNHVVLDEAQDTNPLRRALVKRMLNPANGRLYAVGDSAQAIYAFTGANSDALDLIARDFDAKRMPLTVTYRCPKAVVSFVQQWVSHIQAHETAPEGVVRQVKLDPMQKEPTDAKPRAWYFSDALTAEDVVLCRYNKPLVSLAFSLLKDGIACKMAGRDIGQGLIKLATRWKVKTLDALDTKLETYRAKEIAKAKARHSETAEQAVNDRVDCIKVFMERCRSQGRHNVECVVAEITSLFTDDTAGYLTLSSIHKSKGREWDRVFWMQHKDPAREMKDWEITSERNLKYVAGTRAKCELVLVPEGAK